MQECPFFVLSHTRICEQCSRYHPRTKYRSCILIVREHKAEVTNSSVDAQLLAIELRGVLRGEALPCY